FVNAVAGDAFLLEGIGVDRGSIREAIAGDASNHGFDGITGGILAFQAQLDGLGDRVGISGGGALVVFLRVLVVLFGFFQLFALFASVFTFIFVVSGFRLVRR